MSRQIKVGLLMLPVGFVSGFICAFVIVSGCVLFHLWFGRLEYDPKDAGTYVLYAVAAGYAPGGMVGFLLTPIVCLVCFTRSNNRELVRVGCMIGAGTILFGMFGCLVNELYALLTSLVGFIGSVLAAFSYVKDKEAKRIADHGAG